MHHTDVVRRWTQGRQYWYRRLFASQDLTVVGKPGVILAEMGVPESYEFDFYRRFTEHIFEQTMPKFVRRLVLRDHGRALIDPDQPLAREPFQPKTLVDCYGSEMAPDGLPYVEHPVQWRPPGMRRNPRDHGHFVWCEAGPSGTADILEKVGAKIAGWYYGRLLPEKGVPWRQQTDRIYDLTVRQLSERYADLACRRAYYSDPVSLQESIDSLISSGCETLIFQSYCSPVYCDLEEYACAFPAVQRQVAGRAKIVFADQLGVQPALHRAYTALIGDALAELDPKASVLLILSRHGHPFARETYDLRAHEYVTPLVAECRRLLGRRSGHGEITLSFDEYADSYWDPKGARLSTHDAFRRAVDEGFDLALEAPIEFVAENTDTMILHALHKFSAFAEYDPYAPIPYVDWDQPLRREFREGKTLAISLGCPVGPYSTHVAQAVVDTIIGLLGE